MGYARSEADASVQDSDGDGYGDDFDETPRESEERSVLDVPEDWIAIAKRNTCC